MESALSLHPSGCLCGANHAFRPAPEIAGPPLAWARDAGWELCTRYARCLAHGTIVTPPFHDCRTVDHYCSCQHEIEPLPRAEWDVDLETLSFKFGLTSARRRPVIPDRGVPPPPVRLDRDVADGDERYF